MDISAFEAKLNGLLNEVSNVPAAKINKPILLASKTKLKSKSPKPDLNKTDTLAQSLDHLQLVVKYLIFDIEATRRENKYLRKILEGQED